MLMPINLSVEDLDIATNGKAYHFYDKKESMFLTSKHLLLKCKNLSDNDKKTISQLPDTGLIKMKTVDVGVFTVEL